jgi:hypothetical protein
VKLVKKIKIRYREERFIEALCKVEKHIMAFKRDDSKQQIFACSKIMDKKNPVGPNEDLLP